MARTELAGSLGLEQVWSTLFIVGLLLDLSDHWIDARLLRAVWRECLAWWLPRLARVPQLFQKKRPPGAAFDGG